MALSPEAAVHPVILRVPADAYLPLAPRDRVRFLSGYARQALILSAALRGVVLAPDQLVKDSLGRPLSVGGGYWSVSHKPQYVAGIFSPEPVGIDIERIRPYNLRLQSKVATNHEWRLVKSDTPDAFFRFWTAKEAVLKIGGIGIADLLKCRVRHVDGRRGLSLRYRHRDYRVCHTCVEDHIAAVVLGKFPVQWRFPELP
ncbi:MULTISPECIES: 4'-phosphopantetheinyl transferase family protein [Desulfococcus]|uniref:4'-phosphopantetheinyl transferase n=1 Tax=Desulfococcus multivorans DSM 2059 TaxID=1121405 RepID=S7TAJ7_DESML|nr:4'-phosphopantetheinyl transferase superfamily protein [Desulfococcus multivorans]AQV01703.1 hypothetical protein B2D07_13655 [Desulfococcus multivorans]EPR34152.1 4'-phosphopantetheinyl transferase [Desulfococcus multivorans DSM 2059]SKA19497.1 4'-phosphopantetheinyl transferase [Desulfococcus multivorans DSM 2059]